MHTKRMLEKFTNSVIETVKRDLDDETAARIQTLSNQALNIIKPETIKFLSKFNALIDKNFAIPAHLPIGEHELQNTLEMDDYEKQVKKEIADLELIYKQQAVLMNRLMCEKKLYDTELIGEVESDMASCNIVENNFVDSNASAELVESVMQQLNAIENKEK